MSVSRVACRVSREERGRSRSRSMHVDDSRRNNNKIKTSSSRCSCTGSHSHSQRATGVRTHFIVEERLIDDVCMMHVRARMPVDNGSGGGYASS